MALESGQPVGHLCDLLGISRFRPGVFDEMADLLFEEGGDQFGGEAGRDARLADVGRRMTGRH